MSTQIGFIDESGDKSIQYDKQGVTTFFVVAAIIINEKNIDDIRKNFQAIAGQYTQASEIKSSAKVFKNVNTRLNFLKEISTLDFKIYSIVVDKRLVFEDSALKFKNTFYKYINKLLDLELYTYYPYLELIADKHGTDDFMQGFIDYIEKNHAQQELFKGPTFRFADSRSESLIQLADMIAGSIRKYYESDEKPEYKEIFNILKDKVLHICEWPELPVKFLSNTQDEDEKVDQTLVDFIFNRIEYFITENENTSNVEIKNQLICLRYLIYRFKLDPYSYVYADEILQRINVRADIISKRILNKEIITKLRENKILITSSVNGYKIACCKGDIIRFYNNYSSKIIPMIETVGKVENMIKNATHGKIKMLETDEYRALKDLLTTLKDK